MLTAARALQSESIRGHGACRSRGPPHLPEGPANAAGRGGPRAAARQRGAATHGCHRGSRAGASGACGWGAPGAG
eukprot:3573346-Lingulodinium_polyedra.AAC.1